MERSLSTARPPTSQRSLSLMTIDTAIAQNTYTPQLKRNHSVAQPRPRSVYSSEPVMSPDELTAKIADSFQQFSSMLNQMQKTTTTKQEQLQSPTVNDKSRPSTPNNKHYQQPKYDTKRSSLKEDETAAVLSPVSLASSKGNSPSSLSYTKSLSSEAHPLDRSAIAKSNTKQKMKKAIVTQDRSLVNSFLTAASNGNTLMVQDLVQQCRDLIYCNDDEGTTALIYAACFGHIDTVQWLLEANAPVDEQDNMGWTALMWATVNHHDNVLSVLLSHGARSDIKSYSGNTAFDLVLEYDTALSTLLQPASEFSRRHSVTVDRMVKRKKSKQRLLRSARRQSTPVLMAGISVTASTTINAKSNQRMTSNLQHSGMDTYTHFMTTESDRHRVLTHRHELFYDALLNLTSNTKKGTYSELDHHVDIIDDPDSDDDSEELAKYEASIRSANTFVWDNCLADQMFVFSMDDLGAILDVALDVKSIPKWTASSNSNKDDSMWVPADLLFLCARFIYYYASREVILPFFDTLIGRLTKTTKQCSKDSPLLCYWMTNIHQLMAYLRRDTGLEQGTQQQVERLAGLAAEVYTLFIRDCERRLDKMMDSTILDHQPIHGMMPLDFVDSSDWSKFFQRRSSMRTSMDAHLVNTSPHTIVTSSFPSSAAATTTTSSTIAGAAVSTTLGTSAFNNSGSRDSTDGMESCSGPQAMISMLNGINDMMTTFYELPSFLARHTMMQCFHYILCECFNQILANKKYLCRSKAMTIRLNVSVLEEWARLTSAGTGSVALNQLRQLLQLLQCLSGLNSVEVFASTCQEFTLLNAMQIRRCVTNYRYETQEPQLPKVVEEWVAQRTQLQGTEDRSIKSEHSLRQLKTLLIDSKSDNGDSNTQKVKSISTVDKGQLALDSRCILPFYHFTQTQRPQQACMDSLQSQQELSSESMYQEIKQKAKEEKKGSMIRIPNLPYKLIDRLDKKLHK